MFENYEKEQRTIQNSDILRRTIYSLVYVARLKTSRDYAWSIIKKLLLDLKSNHDFLKYVTIGEIKSLKDCIEDISVMSEINQIESNRIGKAIQEIVDTYKTKMGKKAGYFFLNEFKEILGEEYYKILKEIGVDLRLIDLQNQIYGYGDGGYKIKEKSDSNIAFIEKNDVE